MNINTPIGRANGVVRTRKHSIALVFVCLVGLLGAAMYVRQSFGDLNTPHNPLLSESKPNMKPESKLLFEEALLTGHYYFGDGLGVNCSLEVKQGHRFHFSWHGCGGVYDKNDGSWVVQGDEVVFSPEQPNKCDGLNGMNVRYYPVTWGKRIYLVDEYEMPSFCASLKAKVQDKSSWSRDRLHGHDYVSEVEHKIAPTSGEPILPLQFMKYYNGGPIKAKVVRMEQSGLSVLNVGRADGIESGLKMAPTAWERFEVEIISISEHESLAKPGYYWNSDRLVKVGDEFTTGREYSRPGGTGLIRLDAPPPPDKTPKK